MVVRLGDNVRTGMKHFSSITKYVTFLNKAYKLTDTKTFVHLSFQMTVILSHYSLNFISEMFEEEHK